MAMASESEYRYLCHVSLYGFVDIQLALALTHREIFMFTQLLGGNGIK